METSALKENGKRLQGRTRLERRLLLCATVTILLACELAVVSAAMIYRGQNSSEVSNMDSAAALQTVSNCEERNSVCNTPECVIAAAELIQNMDKKIDPCEDFYSFACGGFEAKTVIPEDKSEVFASSLIDDRVSEQLRILIEKPIKEDEAEPFKLVKKFYQSCGNKTRLEELGLDPLKEILEQIGGWPVVEGDKWNETNFHWKEMIYQVNRFGYDAKYLFDITVTSNKENSSYFIVDVDQAGFDAIDKTHLVEGLESLEVKAYLEFQIGLAKLLGADEESARIQQTQALEFEIMLANISLSHERSNESYNPFTIKELSEKVPDIPWLEYLNNVMEPYVLTEDERVIVEGPDYFTKLVDLLAKTPKRTLANYLMWKVSFDSVEFLNEAARNLQLEYTVALNGITERKPRWKECTEIISSKFGFAVGAMYVREYFDEDIRQPVNEMVNDIRSAFFEIIDETEWMHSVTKIRARKKVAAMKAHIAYPEELLNDKTLTDYYEKLTVNSNDYLRNYLNERKFQINNAFKTTREPVNKNDWIFLNSPVVVNAHYSLYTNTFQIPAAMLQGAFLGKNRPTYLNYATLGWVIGHVIIYGFDDQGRYFDHEGNNVVDWWDESTANNYVERAQCMVEQYGNYTYPELELNLDGIKTLDENIAENEGIKGAYRAYIKWANRQKADSGNLDEVEQRLPGLGEYNVRQLFWLQAASAFCWKSRPEQLRTELLTENNSPLRFRVIGAFSNMPQFASDYNCPVGSAMNPLQKCPVW